MTLASEIIHRAYRDHNLFPTVSVANSNQTDEALDELNSIVDNLFEHEVGTELQDWPVGGTPPTGLWTTWDATVWVNPQPNTRLIVSTTTPTTIYLPKTPDNGARLQVLDFSGGMNITLNANGGRIDGAASVAATASTWVYWAHTGQWTKLATLAAASTIPFPTAYDNFFVAALAMRLVARAGLKPSAEVVALVQRGLEQFRYDYRQTSPYDDGRVGSLLTEALRLAGLVPNSGTPRQAQVIEALRRLNEVLEILLGSDVGVELRDLNIGGEFDQSSVASQWVPANARLVLNLEAADTLDLHPLPHDGQRLAVTDAAGNLATYNLTLDGNGRAVESSATLVLSTNGLDRQWLYRADLGAWTRITDVTLDSTPPLPREFDDLLIAMTAMRLNPREAAGIRAATGPAVERSRSRLSARYRKPRGQQDLGTYGLMGDRRGYSGTTADFNAGRAW